MATKSILKNINIKNVADVKKLVLALENAESFERADDVIISRTTSNIEKKDIRKFFEGVQKDI